MPQFISKLFVIWSLVLTTLTVSAATPEEVEFITKSAQRGSDGAQVLLAGIYREGAPGYPQNDRLAAYWYEQAAEKGNVYAEQMLGDLYEQGKGVEKNLVLAADWREKAAKRGSVQAQLQLGKMYLYGKGVARNAQLAAHWLDRASIEGSSEAQFLYAKMFQTGYGVEQNKAAADNWLAKSAAQGYEDAIRLIHFMESVGFMIEDSFNQRLPDLSQLARDGDVEAQYQLGLRFETGAYGWNKDGASAVAWYQNAAQKGHAAALRSLIQIYEKGIEGVPADSKSAQYWKRKLEDVEHNK